MQQLPEELQCASVLQFANVVVFPTFVGDYLNIPDVHAMLDRGIFNFLLL
jgi:hypothetical protein